MNTTIRIAVPSDASSFVTIKNKLPMLNSNTDRGGFLLGTNEQTYQLYIKKGFSLVAEVNGQIVGFGIVLPNDLLKSSDIWKRRDQAKWSINLSNYENRKLFYFEQLAFLPGYKKLSIILAFNIVKFMFDIGNEFMFTTTVLKPVFNNAALPFIEAVKGINAGCIDEYYEGIGAITSSIYIVDATNFYTTLNEHPLFTFLENNDLKLAEKMC